jgi:hypothetical protein
LTLSPLAVAQTQTGLTLISAYGLIENGYAITTVHRLLSDLTPLFDSTLGKRVVFAGDLNLSTQFPEPSGSRHLNLFQRMNTLGLTDCLALQRPPRTPLANCPCTSTPCLHAQTLRHPRSKIPWQNDYFFISTALTSTVTACFPVDSGKPDPWRHSDHCPLVLEISGQDAN